MALNYSTNPTFSGRITAADANYPYGSSKDETSPGANDGMPHIKQRADDLLGFMQALLKQATPEIVPSGSADTAVASQYVDAIRSIINNENCATLGGQPGPYYQALANATGNLPSAQVSGNFPQSQVTDLITDLAARLTQDTDMSNGSTVGGSYYFQLGNILVNVGSGTVVKNATTSFTFSRAFDAVTTVLKSHHDQLEQDFAPHITNVTNSGFDVVAGANSGGDLGQPIHYIAIGWKN
jgi:hypothetical protein